MSTKSAFVITIVFNSTSSNSSGTKRRSRTSVSYVKRAYRRVIDDLTIETICSCFCCRLLRSDFRAPCYGTRDLRCHILKHTVVTNGRGDHYCLASVVPFRASDGKTFRNNRIVEYKLRALAFPPRGLQSVHTACRLNSPLMDL
jgi:hypothetical protein